MDLDHELGERLTAAAPPLVRRTPQLSAALDALVTASEPPTPLRRRGARVAVVAGAAAAVLGLGTVASATGILPGWARWTTSSGQTCEVQVHADPLRPGDGEPISATFTAAEREATLSAARAFLADFDYDTVDREDAIAWWQEVQRRIRSEQPDPAERAPRFEGDELEIIAVTRSVVEEMRADLASQGLDLRAVAVGSSSTGCEL